MYPILLQIGPATIYSLWVFLALGIFVSLLIVNKLAKSRLIKLAFLAENSLLIFLCGLIAARLTFIAYNFAYYWNIVVDQGHIIEIFYIWDKGLSSWGGLAGIFLSLYLLSKNSKEDYKAWSDILVVSVAFAMFFINIGAFLDGRNYGNPTELPWGILVESSQYAIPIHPVQIYAAIYCGLIGLILLQLFNKKAFKTPGIISLSGIFLYSFFRFIEEFMRGDETIYILDVLREAQIYVLITLLLSGYLLYKYFKKYLKEHHSLW
ncbi:prolipoprotein diacylglyceryl transferase [Candidatus Peregrinibacteria bacterium]|nr:prolipoprotein diacylglyceryl transferase [Candidatus Peregrinibacteria bacterium]